MAQSSKLWQTIAFGSFFALSFAIAGAAWADGNNALSVGDVVTVPVKLSSNKMGVVIGRVESIQNGRASILRISEPAESVAQAADDEHPIGLVRWHTQPNLNVDIAIFDPSSNIVAYPDNAKPEIWKRVDPVYKRELKDKGNSMPRLYISNDIGYRDPRTGRMVTWNPEKAWARPEFHRSNSELAGGAGMLFHLAIASHPSARNTLNELFVFLELGEPALNKVQLRKSLAELLARAHTSPEVREAAPVLVKLLSYPDVYEAPHFDETMTTLRLLFNPPAGTNPSEITAKLQKTEEDLSAGLARSMGDPKAGAAAAARVTRNGGAGSLSNAGTRPVDDTAGVTDRAGAVDDSAQR